MRVLICGDRNWWDQEMIENVILELSSEQPDLVIIHGDANGADRIAGKIAESLGIPVEKYPAKWAKYGKAAGPLRNIEMIMTGPNYVIAFHDDIKSSKGTADMLKLARYHQVANRTYKHE